MSGSGKKSLDFHLDLLPVISVLAVCICFLLVTVTWVRVGTMNVSQAIGQITQNDKPNPPSLAVTFMANGSLLLSLKGLQKIPASFQHAVIASRNNQLSWSQFDRYVQQLRQQLPAVTTALLLPKGNSSYEDIIHVMDELKAAGLNDIGVSPLE